MSDPCWKCLGEGWHWSCLEYGCDPEGCWQMSCDCPAGDAWDARWENEGGAL